MFNRKTLTAGLAALTLSVSALASATPASALTLKPWQFGGAIAAGMIGGMALGAVAAHAHPHAPAYAPSYYPPQCYLVNKKVLTPYGWAIKQVQFCQ